jgi:hypothetical protein
MGKMKNIRDGYAPHFYIFPIDKAIDGAASRRLSNARRKEHQREAQYLETIDDVIKMSGNTSPKELNVWFSKEELNILMENF